jgi:hypothetical protein
VANPSASDCATRYPGIATDASLILCEDWEQPNLYDHSNVGGGAPKYGPWYDETGSPAPTRRGYNSYWSQKYGQGSGDSTWTAGNPASPQLGVTCANSVCREAEYCSPAQAAVNGLSSNCWDGNTEASIDIQRAGDYNAEEATITGPNPFDGLQSMFRRVRTTSGKQAELNGTKNFTRSTTIGVTYVLSLSNTWLTSGITNDAWKGDEWDDAGAGGTGGQGVAFPIAATSLLAGDACQGGGDDAPFCPFIDLQAAYRDTFNGGDNSCVTAAAAATATHGHVGCDTRYRFHPDHAVYRRSVNWTNDQWHCVKGQISGLGNANMSVKVWLDGDAEANVIIDVSNLDGTKVAHNLGVSSFYWNAYSNYKQSNAISKPVYRGYDNVHLTRGAPVSCASIGFTAPGGGGGGGGGGGAATLCCKK